MSAPLRERSPGESAAPEQSETELLIEAEPRVGFLVPVGGLATGRSLRRAGSSGDDSDPLGGTAIPAGVVGILRRRAGGGQPLPEELQRAGSAALGRDLSQVRLHIDPEAARLTDSVRARAFTYGQDVYFSAGAYRPGEEVGRQLIAHELGHIGQDSASAGGVIGRADDPAESAADCAGRGVLATLRRQAALVDREVGCSPAAPGQASLAALRRQAALTIRRGWLEPLGVTVGVAGAALGAAAGSALFGGGLGAALGAGVGGSLGYGVGSWLAPRRSWTAPEPTEQEGPSSEQAPRRSWTAVGPTGQEGPSRGQDYGWMAKAVAKAGGAPTAAAANGTPPKPSSRGSKCDWGLAGDFVVERAWNRPPGQGFIIQRIQRDFSDVWFKDGQWKCATDESSFKTYLGDETFNNLNYHERDYWELFPVRGPVITGDLFSAGSIVPQPLPRGRQQWKDTSRGTYVQTGTAYYVRTNKAQDDYAADLGMVDNPVDNAGGLKSVLSPQEDMLAILGQQGYTEVSAPCVFTLKVTWNTSKMKTNNKKDKLGLVTIHITED